MTMEQSVPKRRHLELRRQGITQTNYNTVCRGRIRSGSLHILPLGFTVILHMIFSKVQFNSKIESESR